MQHFGHASKAHKAIWRKVNETGELNMARAEKLLAKFGQTKRNDLGDDACKAHWIVVHHQPSIDGGLRERVLPYLFALNKYGDVKEGAFSFYLNRM